MVGLTNAPCDDVVSLCRHLGLTKETSPCARGFDDSFVFLSGCGNHYNWEPQLDNPKDAIFTPMYADKFWMRDDKHINRADSSDVPADFYSTTSFTDELINYLNDREGEEKPFFAYDHKKEQYKCGILVLL